MVHKTAHIYKNDKQTCKSNVCFAISINSLSAK